MRITRGQVIAGFDAVTLRTALRRVADDDFEASALDDVLGAGATEALATEGLVEKVKTTDRDWWRTTIAGNALAMAKLGKPFARSTAQKALDALLDRAHSVNNDHPEFMFSVARIELFGSMLNESAEQVSDVDVVLELRPRWSEQNFDSWSRQRQDAAPRAFSNIVDRVGWPETEVRQYLKGKSPVLSFCAPDGAPPEAERKVIFDERDPGSATRLPL